MGKKKENPAQNVIKESQTRYEETKQPSQTETDYKGINEGFQNNYNQAIQQQMGNYTDIMNQYKQFQQGLTPTTFNFQKVNADRPKELGQAYGYLNEAMPGYRDFAKTGGYSNQDIQELRARGISPIRAAYGNTMMELDRARALGGASGTPNYIAALSRANRELPGQMADAMTTVNAGLADSIRQGKQFGLQGISNTGSTMGGLASSEAGRMLQAQMANQDADLRAQGMNEASIQAMRQMQLASMGGQANLFGTTPGMSNMFGNQALNSWNQRMGMEQNRMGMGNDLLRLQLQGYGMQQQEQPWWQKALNIGGQIAPFALAPFTGGTSLMMAGRMPQFGGGSPSINYSNPYGANGPFAGSQSYSW